jgi:Ca2+-binding RTX toxin-like protein
LGNREVPFVRFTWTIVEPPAPTPPPASDCIGVGSKNTVITGTNGPDTLIGTNGNNLMNGLGGNDRMNGCDGNDSVNGNAGNDGIAGGQGNDAVSGNAGNDIVQGDAGNDIISGNAGVNTLTGGPGRDIFVCGPNGDTITDFRPGQDLRFGNCILAPAVAAEVAAPDADNRLASQSGKADHLPTESIASSIPTNSLPVPLPE